MTSITTHTGRLKLPYILQGQAQKEVTHNQALNLLDVYVNPVAEDIVNDLPIAAKEGTIYIMDNELAQYVDGYWNFYKPIEHMEVMVLEENQKFVFNKNKWTPVTSPEQSSESKAQPNKSTKPSYESKDQLLTIEQWEEDIILSGKIVTSKNIIPHHSMVIAVNIWVLEEITGVPSFAVGVKEDLSRYGNKLSSVKDTTNIGMTYHPITYYYDTSVTITPNQMEFTGGRIRVNVQYLKPQGSWPW